MRLEAPTGFAQVQGESRGRGNAFDTEDDSAGPGVIGLDPERSGSANEGNLQGAADEKIYIDIPVRMGVGVPANLEERAGEVRRAANPAVVAGVVTVHERIAVVGVGAV